MLLFLVALGDSCGHREAAAWDGSQALTDTHSVSSEPQQTKEFKTSFPSPTQGCE